MLTQDQASEIFSKIQKYSTAEEIEALFQELIAEQERKTVLLASRIAPDLPPDDLLQPHDHATLASHPIFQFEDGLLAGLRAAQMAFRFRLRSA